jgi:hypothetical protein
VKYIQVGKEVLKCMLLLAIIGLLLEGRLGAPRAVRFLDSRLQRVQTAALFEVDIQANRMRERMDAQLTALQTRLFSEVGQTREMLDRRTGDALARVDRAIGTVEALRADLQPTLSNVRDISAHANEASAVLLRRDALPAQLLGLTAATKVTLGQTATTMRIIQQATPELVATAQEIGDNVKETTAASTEASRRTAEVMTNFARATKPLPTWARIGLTVVPPIAQVGASIATTLAVTGKIGK